MATQTEFEFRFALFQETDIALLEINNQEENTFAVSHNQFSTMTADEKNRYKGRMPNVERGEIEDLPVGNLAASVDWRSKGAVNRVQDQGSCGSCWAFSSTAAMEGAHFIKTGTLLKLSESNLVDCDPKSSGCDGGLEIYAFQYLKKHAQELESAYPYRLEPQPANGANPRERLLTRLTPRSNQNPSLLSRPLLPLNQPALLSIVAPHGCTTMEVSSTPRAAEPTSITPSPPLDTDLRVEKVTSSSETPGDHHGVRRDTSECHPTLPVQVFAVSSLMLPDHHPLTEHLSLPHLTRSNLNDYARYVSTNI